MASGSAVQGSAAEDAGGPLDGDEVRGTTGWVTVPRDLAS